MRAKTHRVQQQGRTDQSHAVAAGQSRAVPQVSYTPFETHVRTVGFARAGVVCRPVEKSDVVVVLRPGRTIQKGVRARDRKSQGEE